MKAITLRDIPDEIAETIRRQAESNGTSSNKTVIEMLKVAVRPSRRKCEFHDLDHLSGRWSRAESNEIDRAVDVQRVIDEDMWK